MKFQLKSQLEIPWEKRCQFHRVIINGSEKCSYDGIDADCKNCENYLPRDLIGI